MKKQKNVNLKLKVSQLENKNQFIIETNEGRYFQSYDSLIAFYNFEKRTLTLGVDWDYSKTTLKHLYIFIDGYTNVYLPSSCKNKRKYIQSLIDKKEIVYNSNMQ